MSQFLEQLARAIQDRRLLRRQQAVLVAVSGGLDSMTLLQGLHHLSGPAGWKLTVAHFNHQLRGEESDGDEKFVAGLAAQLGLPCTCGRGDVRERMQSAGVSLEMAARELRHEFLGQTAKRLGIPAIALAHHADDQAELFFIRLLRGAGGEGLAGMKWLAPSFLHPEIKLVRPLLAFRKTDLERHARDEGVRHREDSSNASHQLLRNRIRHELLPMLTQSFDASAVSAIVRSMEIIGADAACVEQAAQAWLAGSQRQPFGRLHQAVQRQCLRLQLIELGLAPEFYLIEQLRATPNTAVSTGATGEIYRRPNGLMRRRHPARGFNPTSVALDLAAERGTAKFGGLSIQWQVQACAGQKRPRAGGTVEFFDADRVGTVVRLRHWRKGDRYRPIGMKQNIKLQDFFTNLKIPRDRRRELVVATGRKGEIFWVEGLRIAEGCKLVGATRRRLEWRWAGKN